jgi:hypothetical protein
MSILDVLTVLTRRLGLTKYGLWSRPAVGRPSQLKHIVKMFGTYFGWSTWTVGRRGRVVGWAVLTVYVSYILVNLFKFIFSKF